MQNPAEGRKIFELVSEICSQIDSILDIDQLIVLFAQKIGEVFKAERVSFMLLDRAKQELSIKTSCGLSYWADSSKMQLGEMFGGWVAQQGRPLLVKNVETEFPDLSKKRLSRYKSKSFVIVPIEIKDGVLGILNLTDRKNSDIFTEDDLKVINFLCRYFALRVENIKLLNKHSEQITVDILTGLFNHRYFQEQLTEEIYRAERYRHPLSLLMLDIDKFYWYNQNYGYSAGDSALKQIGRLIKQNIRRIDLAARYGPEEFMVILPNTRLKQAIFVGEKIRETIGYSVFTDDRSSSLGMERLTVSVGVAEYRIGLTKDELISRLVKALLEAKQKGKNCVCASKTR
ncbi:MAG: sensor domain-containing diguanylate cyclase [Candidatus Omnitrophota bacterium]|jgi:diguanylate cyclase (GGDEF)-like protein